MCKICWKLTIKTPEQSHWRHSSISTLNSKHILPYALVFLVFLLLTLNKQNLGLVVRVTIPKNCDIALLLFIRNTWFTVVRGELRTCDTSKMVLFCENSLQFKVVNNFGKKLHFKICYGMLNLPGDLHLL